MTLKSPTQPHQEYNLGYDWLTDQHFDMLHGSSDTQPIEVWHKRLGHLNVDAVRQLTKRASGILIGTNRPGINQCIACLQSRQHKQISRVPRIPATKKLEIVHIDIKGPCDIDVHGFRYWTNFLCKKTRFNRGYALTKKNELFKAFLAFEAVSERESGDRILSLMLDGGGENLTKEWTEHLTRKGIQIRQTQPYSPEMNGIAERLIRVLTEHASAML